MDIVKVLIPEFNYNPLNFKCFEVKCSKNLEKDPPPTPQ
jgi:hypothetical protein